MVLISNYMVINYLNCLLKAVTSLRVSSGRQRQAAANFDISPYFGFNFGNDDFKSLCTYNESSTLTKRSAETSTLTVSKTLRVKRCQYNIIYKLRSQLQT